MSPSEKSIAVCPGSYDPITNGHLDVIRRAANLYDEVVVAVVNRSVRKSKALFGIEERMASSSARSPIWRGFAPSHSRRSWWSSRGAWERRRSSRDCAISDFEYELEMNQLNRRQDPQIESVYLMASPQYSFLSSSGVKELATFGEGSTISSPTSARRLQEELKTLTKWDVTRDFEPRPDPSGPEGPRR